MSAPFGVVGMPRFADRAGQAVPRGELTAETAARGVSPVADASSVWPAAWNVEPDAPSTKVDAGTVAGAYAAAWMR